MHVFVEMQCNINFINKQTCDEDSSTKESHHVHAKACNYKLQILQEKQEIACTPVTKKTNVTYVLFLDNA